MNSNPNFIKASSFTYKDLLLRKLYYSVVSSVLSQLVLLHFYVFFANFNPLHPINWLLSTLETFTSFSVWLYIIPFLTIIFAQSVICAKDYVFKSSYCSTRFQKFVLAFSRHNVALLLLHIITGPTLIWLFLSLGGGEMHQSISRTNSSKKNAIALNEGVFYLVVSGFWTGFYYFMKVYISDKHVSFPVIQQRKWLQLKAQVLPLLRDSFVSSIWPTLYFTIIYYMWGRELCLFYGNTFGLLPDNRTYGLIIHFYLWAFSALYYFNMNLMKLFFNIFLTEKVEFPLWKLTADSLALQEGIVMSDLPIIQNLACLDLYNLVQWSKVRREVFYVLSQPGGHPHNWNSLIENVLKVLKEYIELLNKSTVSIERNVKVPVCPPLQSFIQSPKFRNLRNMSLLSDTEVDVVDVTHSTMPGITIPETFFTGIKQKINNFVSVTRVLLGIDFLFGELPEANIQKCLANGLIIIWTSQGISDLLCCALVEDKFGVVQKDIPSLVTTLVQLKQSLDNLNKVPALTKKIAGYQDFNCRMKGAVSTAVKRSLFNVYKTYKNYINDFPLNKDVVLCLQNIYKS